MKDLGLADWGRKEIDIAETEMPGLMAVRAEYGPAAAEGRENRRLPAHDDPNRGADRNAASPWRQVRWASCNIFSTQDHAAAAIAAKGTPVFATKGETLLEYWDYAHKIFEWAGGSCANMILDDGGDASAVCVLGPKAEKDPSILDKPPTRKKKRSTPR